MTTRDHIDQASLFGYILLSSAFALLYTESIWVGIIVAMLTPALLAAACFIPKESFYKRRLGVRRISNTLNTGWVVAVSLWMALWLFTSKDTTRMVVTWIAGGTLMLLFLRATFEIEGSAHEASWRDRRNEEG